MTSRIIIIGGGFAGVEAAFTLAKELRSQAGITLIDRVNSHIFNPSLHEIISGRSTSESISIPLDAICRPLGVELRIEEVQSVDPLGRSVRTGGGEREYDYLLLTSGAENTFYGVEDAERWTRRFRTLNDAERIRKELLTIIADSGARRTILLVGGGTEGVEVAGEIIDTIRQEGADDDLGDGVLRVVVVEGAATLLPGFPKEAQDYATEQLAQMNVQVRTATRISGVKECKVTLENGEELGACLIIWTGGIRPSALVRDLQAPKDAAGWLLVRDTMNSPGDDRIYAAGDAVVIETLSGPIAIQRLAYHATDQGRMAALNIARRIRGEQLVGYRPEIRPQLISIGKKTGIMISDGKVRTGSWVVDLKKAVERKHLLACLTRAGLSLVARKLRS